MCIAWRNPPSDIHYAESADRFARFRVQHHGRFPMARFLSGTAGKDSPLTPAVLLESAEHPPGLRSASKVSIRLRKFLGTRKEGQRDGYAHGRRSETCQEHRRTIPSLPRRRRKLEESEKRLAPRRSAAHLSAASILPLRRRTGECRPQDADAFRGSRRCSVD